MNRTINQGEIQDSDRMEDPTTNQTRDPKVTDPEHLEEPGHANPEIGKDLAAGPDTNQGDVDGGPDHATGQEAAHMMGIPTEPDHEGQIRDPGIQDRGIRGLGIQGPEVLDQDADLAICQDIVGRVPGLGTVWILDLGIHQPIRTSLSRRPKDEDVVSGVEKNDLGERVVFRRHNRISLMEELLPGKLL